MMNDSPRETVFESAEEIRTQVADAQRMTPEERLNRVCELWAEDQARVNASPNRDEILRQRQEAREANNRAFAEILRQMQDRMIDVPTIVIEPTLNEST